MKQFLSFQCPAVSAWAVSLCGITGTVLLLSGVMCFFAYNWQNMGIVLKLGLPLLGLLGGAYAAYRKGLKSGAGEALSLACGLFLGIFFAVYGQVFQTGAFVYEFFKIWAVCLLPLAVLANNRWLWLLWAAVVNGYILSAGYSSNTEFWLVFGFNTLCYVGAEWAYFKSHRGGWTALVFLSVSLLACVLRAVSVGRAYCLNWLIFGFILLFLGYALWRRRGAAQLGICMLGLDLLLLEKVLDWNTFSIGMFALVLFTASAWGVYVFSRREVSHD